MTPLVFVLVIIGFAGFASAVVYEQVQGLKTGGEAFEGRGILASRRDW